MYDLLEMKERIKKRKNELHLTNEALAIKADIAKGTLNKMLGSETKDPQISTIIRIAKALDVSADYLILGDTSEGSTDNFEITDFEKRMVCAYRSHPEMQPAINKMLDIDIEEKTDTLKSQIA